MRITRWNLDKYLKDTYGATPTYSSERQLDNFVPLLQKDYGGEKDCVLTCISAIIYFLIEQKSTPDKIYQVVEKYAKKYGYRPNCGTHGVTVRKIFQESLIAFGMKQAYGKFIKNVGFKFANIRNEINKGNPLILSILNDGQKYYENHSLTIVGYKMAKIKNKEIPILIVYDNWYKVISYIDYNKMSVFSSIHYAELTFKQTHQMWKKSKSL